MIETLQKNLSRFDTSYFFEHASQKQYAERGYVVTKLFDGNTVNLVRQKLLSIRNNIHEDVTNGVFATGCSPNFDLRNITGEVIDEYVKANIHLIINPENADFLGGTMLLKAPGPTGLLGPHIDNPIVDEEVTSSIFAWIPLEDVDETNGCVHVLPESHRLGHPTRGMYTTYPYREFDDFVYEHAVPVKMKAGEVLMLDHALIHFSYPNKTDKERIAIAFGIKPKNAPQLHFYKNPEQNLVSVYEIDRQFYFYGDIFNAPPANYRVIRQAEPSENHFSRKDFENFFSAI